MSIAEKQDVAELIALAKREDLGTGDLSSQLLADATERVAFALTVKQPGILAGCEIAQPVLAAYDGSIEIVWSSAGQDGAKIDAPPTQLATVTGPVGAVLAAERVLLNFLQRLSGVATKTRAFVDAVADTDAKVFDTRKTTPGWRRLEKYAVRCGGGSNHRHGLFDAVLIKDNHLHGVATDRLAATVFEMLNRLEARKVKPSFVQIEARSMDQVEQLLKIVGIDVILLDNFSLDQLREAVAWRNELGLGGKIELEASGGIDLDTVRAVAQTGVDRVSVGALTHSAVALDISLDRI